MLTGHRTVEQSPRKLGELPNLTCVRSCGYLKLQGRMAVSASIFTAFYEALLRSQGVTLGNGQNVAELVSICMAAKLSYIATVRQWKSCWFGKAYTGFSTSSPR